LIERGITAAIGLRIERGEHREEMISGSIASWLATGGDAIAIDLRTPGEAVLAHRDVLCRMRYVRDRVDFTVHDVVRDGPAMHHADVVAAIDRFAEEHRS
jgi:hypothetical protein